MPEEITGKEKICDYGCGRKANYKFKNGKVCCSSNHQSCPSVRKKNSEGVKEAWMRGELCPPSREDAKKGWFEEGNDPWHKGKSYRDLMGENEAQEHIEKITRGLIDGKHNDKQKEKKRREKISESMKNNPRGGGRRKNSGVGKGCWYESKIAGRVYLDSSYELAYAEYLDENNINWRRNTKEFSYEYQGEERNYIPDFYLIREDKFVEIKGFKTEKDEIKWEHFPHELVVYYKDNLIELGCDI